MKEPVIYNGDDTETVFPSRWEICGTCNGEGKHSRGVESDGGGITASEMAEMDNDDPGFSRRYFRGDYDRPCEPCGGSGKVKVADKSRMTRAQWRAYRDQVREVREMDAVQAAERRAGA